MRRRRIDVKDRRHVLSRCLMALAMAALVVSVGTTLAAGGGATTILYDDFSDPAALPPGIPPAPGSACAPGPKWCYAYGPLEAGVNDANHYRKIFNGAERMRALPFTQGADFSVYDHLKLMEVSTQAFPLPANGSVEFSADITASTPGVVKNLTQQGIYGQPFTWTDPSAPPQTPNYSAKLLEGQQAGVVLNMVDFCTGQLFDWFLSSSKAFTLIERLPTNVTGNTSNPYCPGASFVGPDTMYTQIADEVNLAPGKHKVAIRVTQNATDFYVEYFLDGKVVTKIGNIGVPLDKQGVKYTGIYPSLGNGEILKGKIAYLTIGHGLFSLLDAFPYQHPDAPELSVSIPVGTGNPADAGRARLFGQGADATYDNFRITTVGG
jgi:Family of unknown function (DUF6081)